MAGICVFPAFGNIFTGSMRHFQTADNSVRRGKTICSKINGSSDRADKKITVRYIVNGKVLTKALTTKVIAIVPNSADLKA